MSHRVVITGMGCVTPIGLDRSSFLEGLLAGRSGGGPLTLFDPGEMPARIACQVDWQGDLIAEDRRTTFGVEAARQAMEHTQACGSEPRGDGRLFMGIGNEIFSPFDWAKTKLPDFEYPATQAERHRFLHMPADLISHVLSHKYGFRRPPLNITSACASSTDALVHAYREVASGRSQWVLVGGTDCMIDPIGITAFAKLWMLSTMNDDPQHAYAPFCARRDGFVMGEGAGMLVLERLEDAEARGAEIHGEIAGAGNSLDAHLVHEPHPGGRGALQAMHRALDSAGVEPEDIDAINCQATGTPKSDLIETNAYKTLFGLGAGSIPISATKSMIGHLIAGAGATELIAAVMCMQRDMVHPTINLDQPDPECDLDYVPLVAREHATKLLLFNSFGFGGMNASLVIRKL